MNNVYSCSNPIRRSSVVPSDHTCVLNTQVKKEEVKQEEPESRGNAVGVEAMPKATVVVKNETVKVEA